MSEVKYVYQRSEPGLWTVGYYSPSDEWITDSDHGCPEAAADRAAWLNGRAYGSLAARLAEAERVLRICANYPPAGMRPQDAKPFFAGFIPAEQRAAREYFAARAAVSAVVAQEPKP